jgi:nicotinamide riboside kinase
LDENNLTYHVLRGTFEQRFDEAVEIIEELLKKKEVGL